MDIYIHTDGDKGGFTGSKDDHRALYSYLFLLFFNSIDNLLNLTKHSQLKMSFQLILVSLFVAFASITMMLRLLARFSESGWGLRSFR